MEFNHWNEYTKEECRQEKKILNKLLYMANWSKKKGFIINNGLFYVLGGDDGSVNLSSVEVYNPQRNVWSLLPQFLNNPKSYISCLQIENSY